MTTPDKQEGQRRVRTHRGFVLIILGLFVLLVAAVRHDENSWQGFLLASISLSLGAFWVVRALRP